MQLKSGFYFYEIEITLILMASTDTYANIEQDQDNSVLAKLTINILMKYYSVYYKLFITAHHHHYSFV